MVVQHQPDAEDHSIRSVAWNGNGGGMYHPVPGLGPSLHDFHTYRILFRPGEKGLNDGASSLAFTRLLLC